jgi:DNA-binding HxlR family transcriptional regulator
MDEEIIRKYLERVPAEIREAVMELDTPDKWAIYIALTLDGDKYFNQLKKEFKANPNTIDKNLKSLMAGGLIQRKVKELADVSDRNKNYYTSTLLGEKLLVHLSEVIAPPLAVVEQNKININLDEHNVARRDVAI